MNRTPLSKATRILSCLVITLAMTATVKADDHHGCSARSVAGTFGYTVTGIRNGVGPVAGVGQLTFHRDGTISDGKQTVSFNGVIAEETYTGTFTVESDCSGTFTVDVVSPIAPRTSHVALEWVGDANGAKAMFTDSGTILTADAKRISIND